MPYIKIPLPGISQPPACDKETTQDFIDKRAKLTPTQAADVERLVESFNTRPFTADDIQLPGTVIGTVHARIRGEAYVLYQQFTQPGQTKLLIKLWYCGAYHVRDGVGRFDFENEIEGTDEE